MFYMSRFIPAWAGQSFAHASQRTGRPVHPRVGGAICCRQFGREYNNTVHPRVGGAIDKFIVCTKVFFGSSPRGRGNLCEISLYSVSFWFIPAWAGQSESFISSSAVCAVHPRVGGAIRRRQPTADSHVGSSPRGRGNLCEISLYSVSFWFIPAWAGQSESFISSSAVCAVHPRVGGAISHRRAQARAYNGSSPRGRGNLPAYRFEGNKRRFIPAWAGQSSLSCPTNLVTAVHPRVGGAIAQTRSHIARRRRFIPAWAGQSTPAA